jgi:hypothetical protein
VLGVAVPVPPALAELLTRPAETIALEPRLAALARELDDWS